MDRDRRPIDGAPRRRDLPPDVPPEDRYGSGGGQSYRPGGAARRSPPPRDFRDSYRARSPRARTPPPTRYRSRSPPRRSPTRFMSDSYPPRRDDYRREGVPRGGDSYRAADRPRREDLPRTDLLRRDPIRDERDFREPYRDDRDRGYGDIGARSPLPRHRDRSVSSRGRRSPPRTARFDPPSRGISPPRRRYSPEPRERRSSPPRGVTRDYRLRSRSPLTRNHERVDPRTVDDWRRRSPVREPRQEYLRDESAAHSGATSRRSSPPAHIGRPAYQPAYEEIPRSSRASPRDPYETREPYRPGEVDPLPRHPNPEREPAYEDDRGYSNGRELPPPREPKRDDSDVPAPRAPPTGPSSQRIAPAQMAPPSGPAATVAPLGPRSGGLPAGPRGGFASRGDFGTRGDFASRGDFAGRGRGTFNSDFVTRGRGGYGVAMRGGRGAAPPAGPGFGRGDANMIRSPEAVTQDATFGARPPPSGPRNSFSQAPAPSFRQQPPTATTLTAPSGPRAQRFPNGDSTITSSIPDAPTGPKAIRHSTGPASMNHNRPHPALADLPTAIPGGQKAEPLIDRTKLSRLEDEAEKLRRQIEEREIKKRKSLREWDRMTREAEAAALRSELAEQALKELNGEAESQAAF